MKNGKRDDEVGSALRKLFAGDDPGEAFDRKVLAGTDAPGGGEHEISALDGERIRRGRWWLLAPLAAAAVILIVVFGTGTGDDPVTPNIDPVLPEEESGMNLAGPGEEGKLLLPFSEKGTEGTDPAIKIRVSADNLIAVNGETVTIQALVKMLRDKSGARPKSDLSVTIVADQRTGWRTLQWVMQACAQVKLHRLSFTVAKSDGSGTAELPVPLPHDTGLDSAPMGASIRLRLVRAEGEKTTRVYLINQLLGIDNLGIDSVPTALAKASIGGDPRLAEIRASPSVPHAQVIRAIDKLLASGIERILFQGAPPPPDLVEDTPAGPTVRVTLRHSDGETTVRVGEGERKPFSPAVGELVAAIRKLRRLRPDARAVLDCEEEVPQKAITAVLDAFQKAGFKEIRFEGQVGPSQWPTPPDIIEEAPASPLISFTLRQRAGRTEVRVAGGDWRPFPRDEVTLRKLVAEFRVLHPNAKATVDAIGEVPPKAVAAMWEALIKANFTDHEWVEGEIEEEIIEEEILRDGVPARRSVRVKLRLNGGTTFLNLETSRTVRMEGIDPVVNTKTSSARLEEGLEVLRGLLRDLTGRKLRLRGVLAAESEVPFGDAKKVMQVFEEFGIDDIVIETDK